MSTLARTAPFRPGALPRVNLLPRSEVQRREARQLARSWVTVGFGALIVTVAITGGAFALNLQSGFRLAAANAETQRLITGIAQLAPVSQAQAQRGELTALVEQAMAGDIAWQPAVDIVAGALPAGVEITSYTLAAGDVPAEADAAATVGAAGSFTVTSAEPLSLVDATRALRGVDQVLGVTVQSLAEAEGTYTYTIELQLDQSIYTGAFAPEAE